MNDVVSPDAAIEKVAGNFLFLEGPVWINDDNILVFSDIPGNKIHKLNTLAGEVSLLLNRSGFTGTDATSIGREVNEGNGIFYNLGSNGATLDPQGRLVFNAMGDRQIIRLEHNGIRTVLASHYQGKRLNSTNDLVYKSDGTLYFTDPPSALRGGDTDPTKELDFNGVYMLKDDSLILLSREFNRPNGLTFLPDEKFLYIANARARQVCRFEVLEDGTISNGIVFIDMTGDATIGNPDGMKVDSLGNLYVAGAGGIWVVSAEGIHLGKLLFPERASNMTFGDTDAKTLYVTARTSIYRVRLKLSGLRP
ncbi:MAG: SMP-30/gluconolactonase/LRE family protein [Gammaproteobacteria bacterium]|jgi:gluconolactonase